MGLYISHYISLKAILLRIKSSDLIHSDMSTESILHPLAPLSSSLGSPLPDQHLLPLLPFIPLSPFLVVLPCLPVPLLHPPPHSHLLDITGHLVLLLTSVMMTLRLLVAAHSPFCYLGLVGVDPWNAGCWLNRWGQGPVYIPAINACNDCNNAWKSFVLLNCLSFRQDKDFFGCVNGNFNFISTFWIFENIHATIY